MDDESKNVVSLLEAMDNVLKKMEECDSSPSLNNTATDTSKEVDEKEILVELNKIFTPILIMQDFEQEISDKANAEMTEASVITERNVVHLDDAGRMAQLTSVCAMLIAKKKNSEAWQIFKKAAAIKRQSKLDIQKQEHDLAKELAQKYLVMVSTTNNSSIARKAADDLLPQTQH